MWSDDNSSCDNTEQKQNTKHFSLTRPHKFDFVQHTSCTHSIFNVNSMSNWDKNMICWMLQNLCTVYDKFTGFLILCNERSMYDIP